MNKRRFKAVAKLAVILGVPIGLVLSLFTSGVYIGATNSSGIRAFERDILGMDLEPLASEKKPDTEQPEAEQPDAEQPDAEKPTEKPVAEKPVAEKPDVKPVEKPTEKPVEKPTEKPVEPVAETPTEPVATPTPREPRTKSLPLAVALAEPLSDELRSRRSQARTVSLKVLVDSEVAGRSGDWLADVQYTVDWASQIFDTYFGIELQLVGVVLWNADNTLDHAAAQAALAEHPAEGADLVLGLRGQKLDINNSTVAPATHNRAIAVAYSSNDLRAPLLRGMLVGIGSAMGALKTTEAGWMTTTDQLEPLQIDTTNRQRILERKQLPFGQQLTGGSKDGSK